MKKLYIPILVLLSFPLWADPVYEIKNLDKINNIDSASAGRWQFTTENLNPYNKDDFDQNLKWKYVSIPNSMGGLIPSPWPTKTIMYLKKEIRFPKDWKTVHLSLSFHGVSDRDRTYLNGVLIGETGVFGYPVPEESEKVRIYDIPSEIIKKGEVNTIVVEVQSFMTTQMGILREGSMIGPSSLIYQDVQNYDNIKITLSTICLAIGFIYLFLFFDKPKKIEYFFFGTFNLLFMTFQIMQLNLLYKYGMQYDVYLNIVYVVAPLMFVTFGQFVRTYFKFKYNAFIIFGDLLMLSASAVITYMNDYHLTNDIEQNFLAYLYLVFILNFISMITIRAFQGVRDAMYMLIPMIMFAMAAVIDTLTIMGITTFPKLVGIAFFPFLISLSMILAVNIMKLRKEVEELNVSLEHKVEERTRELKIALDESNRLKSEQDHLYLLIGVNLKQSVDDIKKFSEILISLEFLESEDRIQVLTDVHKISEDLYDSLDNLTAWTKIQSGLIKPNFQNQSLRDIIMDSTGYLKEFGLSRGIEMNFEVEDWNVNTDQELLTFVVKSIFSNAIKYTPKDGKVQVISKKDGNDCILEIKDSGSGMSKEQVDHIFLMKSDINKAMRINEDDSSIGLKITVIYLNYLNYDIKVISEANLGTSFIINMKNSLVSI